MKQPYLIVGGIILAVLVYLSYFAASQANGPHFVLGFENAPSQVLAGKEVTYRVLVTNDGNEQGTLQVDSGIYGQQEINNWYSSDTFSVQVLNLQTCVSGETNVQNKQVSLGPGESKSIQYTIMAPSTPGLLYAYHAGSFTECNNVNAQSGYITTAIKTVEVVQQTSQADAGLMSFASFDIDSLDDISPFTAFLLVFGLIVVSAIVLFPRQEFKK